MNNDNHNMNDIVSAGTVSAKGVRHLPDGFCTLVPGNTASITHGSYAVLRLSPVAAETADVLRELAPVLDVADEPALQAFGLILEQLKAAASALEQASAEDRRADLLHLSRDARGWTMTALKYAEQFGMTPRARVALGLDLVRARDLTADLTDARATRERRMALLSEQEIDQ